MLSKSRYLKGLKCQKALWLNKHKKEEAFYSESTKQVFSAGNTAGELAQQYFPNGELALVSNYPDSKAIAKTKELIRNGVTTIYEATFASESTLIALDILHQIDGKWHAFEVKSTNSAKKEHIRDAAIQYYVMTKAGIKVEDISIMHFDNTYVKQGAITPRGLFTYESVFDRMQTYLEDIPKNIKTFLEVYQEDEPTIIVGNHCDSPYPCEFANYCNSLQENQSVLKAIKETPGLSTEVYYKNTEAIQQFLTGNPYPIYSFDFETVMEGVPKYDNTRPYQQVPFQYSLHYQKSVSGVPQHSEFLGNGTDDPREGLIKQMIHDFSDEGSILVYYIPFERKRIEELIRDYPQYEKELEVIKNRLVDLLPIFKKHILTEQTKVSASLKVVLPTFLPLLSYKELAIQNGMAAMHAYKNLPETSNKTEFEKKRKEMLAYCKLDTEAVLELYNLLYNEI
jgi:hypothetical protein